MSFLAGGWEYLCSRKAESVEKPAVCRQRQQGGISNHGAAIETEDFKVSACVGQSAHRLVCHSITVFQINLL